MSFIRWLGATGAISVATMLHALLVGLAVAVLFPDVVRHYHDLYADDPVIGSAVHSSIDWGMLAALFMGPMLAFTLVRDYNAAIEKPAPIQGWWRFVVRDAARSFLIIGLAGFSVCGLIAAAIAIQGGTRDVVQYRAFLALVLAHAAAALVVAIGHFVRNPPDLSLGSRDDLGRTEGDRESRL